MLALSDNNQADVIEAFNTTSIYLDDLFNIDHFYFEQMVVSYNPLNFSYITSRQNPLILNPRFGQALVHNEWFSFS